MSDTLSEFYKQSDEDIENFFKVQRERHKKDWDDWWERLKKYKEEKEKRNK